MSDLSIMETDEASKSTKEEGDKAKDTASSKNKLASSLDHKIEVLSKLALNKPFRKREDGDCKVCQGVNIGKMLSCLACDRCTHLDCLEALTRVQYMIKRVHYDHDVWLCSRCQNAPLEKLTEGKDQKGKGEEDSKSDKEASSDFVMIDKSDIPAHDSEQVQKSLPSEKNADGKEATSSSADDSTATDGDAKVEPVATAAATPDAAAADDKVTAGSGGDATAVVNGDAKAEPTAAKEQQPNGNSTKTTDKEEAPSQSGDSAVKPGKETPKQISDETTAKQATTPVVAPPLNGEAMAS